MARKGKSIEQLTSQFRDLYQKALRSGNTQRSKQVAKAYQRYMGNIQKTRIYQKELAARDEAQKYIRKGDTREERLANDKKFLNAERQLNRRTYSRSTYMGNNGG